MSRLCIFTDSYGWVAKATLRGKSQCKHSESQPHSTSSQAHPDSHWEMPSLERDKELILWHLQPGLSL